jgi:hypothetical protein
VITLAMAPPVQPSKSKVKRMIFRVSGLPWTFSQLSFIVGIKAGAAPATKGAFVAGTDQTTAMDQADAGQFRWNRFANELAVSAQMALSPMETGTIGQQVWFAIFNNTIPGDTPLVAVAGPVLLVA